MSQRDVRESNLDLRSPAQTVPSTRSTRKLDVLVRTRVREEASAVLFSRGPMVCTVLTLKPCASNLWYIVHVSKQQIGSSLQPIWSEVFGLARGKDLTLPALMPPTTKIHMHRGRQSNAQTRP